MDPFMSSAFFSLFFVCFVMLSQNDLEQSVLSGPVYMHRIPSD